MNAQLRVVRAALLSAAIVGPTIAWAGPATPTCSDLATNPAWGLAGNPSITGLTAVVTWIGTSGRGGGVDLTLIGKHGVLYHDAGAAPLWDEAFAVDDAPADKDLVAWIERALKSGRPEDAGGRK